MSFDLTFTTLKSTKSLPFPSFLAVGSFFSNHFLYLFYPKAGDSASTEKCPRQSRYKTDPLRFLRPPPQALMSVFVTLVGLGRLLSHDNKFETIISFVSQAGRAHGVAEEL